MTLTSFETSWRPSKVTMINRTIHHRSAFSNDISEVSVCAQRLGKTFFLPKCPNMLILTVQLTGKAGTRIMRFSRVENEKTDHFFCVCAMAALETLAWPPVEIPSKKKKKRRYPHFSFWPSFFIRQSRKRKKNMTATWRWLIFVSRLAAPDLLKDGRWVKSNLIKAKHAFYVESNYSKGRHWRFGDGAWRWRAGSTF